MVTVTATPTPAGAAEDASRPSSHHDLLGAVALAGLAAVAVLVGRDGSPGGRLLRVALVVAVGLAMRRITAVGRPARGRLHAAVGAVVLATGLGFAPFVVKETASVTAVAALVATGAGLGLVVGGTVAAGRGRRRLRRLASAAGAAVGTLVVGLVVGPAVAATNVPRPALGATPADRGLTYEDVTLRTADGVTLAAWYVPAAGRAAVVLLHGAGSTRSSVLAQAEALVGGGYGVLLVDARGHGASGGRAMDFGWHGDADVAAATTWLARRPGVVPDRIGLVGLSMGGEEAIGAAATDPRVRAVVAEGATARTAADEAWLGREFGLRGEAQERIEWLQDRVTGLLAGTGPPTALHDAVAGADARFLLVTAGDVPDEGRAARWIASAAPDRVAVWTVPGAGHTGGLATEPDEWARRVLGFLDDALAPA